MANLAMLLRSPPPIFSRRLALDLCASSLEEGLSVLMAAISAASDVSFGTRYASVTDDISDAFRIDGALGKPMFQYCQLKIMP